MMEIKIQKKVDLKDFTFIEGFPGVGLVGPMTISYVIDKLAMENIGYVDSNDFPPLISIHKNEPMPAVRVYYSEKYKIVTIFAEFAIPLELIYETSNIVFNFIRDNGISKVFSIGGIPLQDPEGKSAYSLASTEELLKEAQDAGLKPIGEGVATGVSALLLVKAVMNKVPDINIMVPINQELIDPRYAVVAVQNLNKLMKLNIDITELEREAKDVEARVRELMKKHAETHESYKKSMGGTGPPTYA